MKEKLSALLDGDLDEDSAGPILDSFRKSPELRDRWGDYCLIGDVLRGDVGGAPNLVAKVMEDLNSEPSLLIPAGRDSRARRSFPQTLMPIAASVMGVAAVGLVAYTLYPQPESGAITARVAPQAQTAAVAMTPVRQSTPEVLTGGDDPHREYVFVHQAMSGGGPIPGGVQYVRTVSDVRGDAR